MARNRKQARTGYAGGGTVDNQYANIQSSDDDTVKASTKADWTPEAYQASLRQQEAQGYAGGGVVRRGYADGGEVVDESAGLNTASRGSTSYDSWIQDQERRGAEETARREAARQEAEAKAAIEREQQAARASPRTLADPNATPQPDTQTPQEQPITGPSQPPVSFSTLPTASQALQQPQTARDVLDYAHSKYLSPTPAGAEPPTGYGERGAADVAARQADEARRTGAARASEGVIPLERMTPEVGTGQLIGGALRRAAGDVAGAFTSKLAAPDEYTPAVAAAIKPLQGRLATYVRGDHAVPPEVLDQHLRATAAANPQATPADVAVKAVTDEKLDMDQKAGLLAGMSQRYATHNAMAQGALAHGDVQSAMRLAQESHNHMPDGQNLTFRQEGDRIIATVDPLGNRPPTEYPMTMQQFHDYLVGPATSFDHVLVNGVAKNLEIASRSAAPRDTGYAAALAGGRGMEQPVFDPAAGAAAVAGGPRPALAPTDVSAQARTGYTPANVDETGAPTYGGTAGYTPANVDETGAPTYGGRAPAEVVAPVGGTLNQPEVGWDKEATRELGGKGDTRGTGASEHKPRGAGAFYRDVTLLRTPQYQKMMRDQGAVPIVDQRGYTRGWRAKPGTSDVDQIPPAGSAPPAWRAPSGPYETAPPPPEGDTSAEARAARNYPAASQTKQRDAAAELYRKQDSEEALEYAKLASAERKGELTTEQKIQLEALRQQGQTGRNEATIAGRKDVATTNITGRQTLQEQRDKAHAERQQNWINFRQDRTAQEIAQKVLTSRENQLVRIYDTAIATGAKPLPEAVEAAHKLATAVNAAGYQAPEMPHAAVGAAASQAAGRTAAGLPAAAPAPVAAPAPAAAPQAAPNASRFEIHIDPKTGQRYRVPVQ